MSGLERYLTTLDSSFLYFEKPTEALHIGSCMVYEGRMERAELIRLLADRLHHVPRYRQRVVFPPLGISHPMWIDDPDFDINHHIDEVELRPGADMAEFSQVIAEAYSGMLDRDRPLWAAVVVHGFDGEHTAVVWKVHHAMIDGVSGIDLTMLLNDYAADAEPPPPPTEDWNPPPLPDFLSLMQEAIEHRTGEVTRALTETAFDALRPQRFAEQATTMRRAMARTLPQTLRPAPSTPWNNRVSGELAWAWADFSFTEARQIKNALGGTVNDLVLTTLSGGLGRYLRARGEKTEGLELRAMCPVSMRQKAEHGKLGNLVSVMIAPLYVGIEDPAERHLAECEGMASLKESKQADAFYEMTRMGELVPPGLQGLVGGLPMPGQRVFNTVSTNVPGPQIPLYQAGRRLLHWLPMGVVSNNIGLFISILTYEGRMTLGATVDRKQIPDPWELSDALRASFDELRELAGVAPDKGFEQLEFTSGSEARAKKRPPKKAHAKKASAKKSTRKKPARKTKKKVARKTAKRKQTTPARAARKKSARKKSAKKTSTRKKGKKRATKKKGRRKSAS